MVGDYPRYRRNADDKMRILERQYQQEGSLEALAKLNAARHLAGQPPQDFLDIWYDYLSNPAVYLYQKGIKNRRIGTYQTTNQGHVDRTNDSYDQTIISLWDGPQGVYHSKYEIKLRRFSDDDPSPLQIILHIWFPNNHISGVSNIGVIFSLYKNVQNTIFIDHRLNCGSWVTTHPEIDVVPPETQIKVFDVRTIPEIIFKALKTAVDQSIIYKEGKALPFLQTPSAVPDGWDDAVSYIELLTKISGVYKNPSLDLFFKNQIVLDKLDEEINHIALRHLRLCEPEIVTSPERGFPEFEKKVITRITNRRKLSRKRVYVLEV